MVIVNRKKADCFSIAVFVSFIQVLIYPSLSFAKTETIPSPPLYSNHDLGDFMRQWLVCGPIPISKDPNEKPGFRSRREAYFHDFLQADGGEKAIHPTTDMVLTVEATEIPWQDVTSDKDIINLGTLLSDQEHAIAYAWADINLPQAQTCLLGVGSDDAIRVWLNGELVMENWGDQPAQKDGVLVPVQLQAGHNQLLIKVQNHHDHWGFTCRFLNESALQKIFFKAIKDGDETKIQQCLTGGIDVNDTDSFGYTPLQMAQIYERKELIEQLITRGADPNLPTPPSGTPLGFLDILWEILQQNYPMLEYAGAFDNRWYESCKQHIQDMNQLNEALPIIDKMLVERLHDYHTSLFWTEEQSLAPPPLQLDLIEGKIVIRDCTPDLGFHPGDIILKIDNEDAKQCFNNALADAFGATQYAKTQSACRTIVQGEKDTEIKLTLKNEQGEIKTVTVKRGRSQSRAKEYKILSSRVIDESTGYIRIRGWHSFNPEAFDEELEPFRNTPQLILDVRDNGGGSDQLAEEVIGRFITDDVLCSVGFEREPGTDNYKKLVFIANPRGPWSYQGKVAVLINAGCASACEHFVSGMIEAGAILIGTPTTGACGWSRNIDLPAGVSLRCAKTFPLHGKVPSPLQGIPPHHLVQPTLNDIRNGRDTLLQSARTILNRSKQF